MLLHTSLPSILPAPIPPPGLPAADGTLRDRARRGAVAAAGEGDRRLTNGDEVRVKQGLGDAAWQAAARAAEGCVVGVAITQGLVH